MTDTSLAAGFLVHSVHLGPLRATPYGLCAAVGLMLGMGIARHSARRTGMDPETAWDAGMFAILGCFFASRLLLVLHDPLAFTRYPLLVLSLPSLTFGGMAVAAIMLLAYLRRKRLALLPLLDVFAPSAAVLAVCLEIGHWLDGSELGMPSALPWAVLQAARNAAVRLHPVALYGAVAAALVALTLWWALQRTPVAGTVAALGLVLGGAIAFLLDMVTQPAYTMFAPWLDPGQWVALAAMLVGTSLWAFAPFTTAMAKVHAGESSSILGTGYAGAPQMYPEVR